MSVEEKIAPAVTANGNWMDQMERRRNIPPYRRPYSKMRPMHTLCHIRQKLAFVQCTLYGNKQIRKAISVRFSGSNRHCSDEVLLMVISNMLSNCEPGKASTTVMKRFKQEEAEAAAKV